MMDLEMANRARDRRLRRRLLHSLHEARSSPTGWLNGRTLMDVVASAESQDQGFVDDGHFLGLMRDLVAKALAEARAETRRRGQTFGPAFIAFRVTAKGSSLVNETIPVDPDIEDDRIEE